MFEDWSKAEAEIEEVDGQIIEKRIEFNYDDLDYVFVFCPQSDPPEEGPTLTYVGDDEKGRLTPSEYAKSEAWVIAAAKFGLKEWVARA